MRSVEAVLDGLAKARQDGYVRNFSYQRFSDAYFGVYGQATNTISDSTGRPIMRMQDLRSELRQRRGAPNLTQPIVDDFVSMKGQIPFMKAEADDENEEAVVLAKKRTYLIKDVWERSSMSVQQKNAGFFLSALGDSVYTLDALLPGESDDLNPPGVYISVYNPRLCFPRFKNGRFSQELAELWITWDVPVVEAEEEWGLSLNGKSDDEMVSVVIHYDGKAKQIIVDDHRVLAVEHNLGWVPCQWVRNKLVGDMLAQADISQAVDVHEEIQSVFLILADSMIEAVYAPIKIRDADNVAGDTLELGPRAVVSVTATGDVSRVEPAPPPTAAQGLLQTLQDALFHVTGTTPVRVEGSMPGSNISGRMVHSVQQPQEHRVNGFQEILGYHFEKLNQKILLMYSKIPELAKATIDIKGSDKGRPYSITTKGEEIGGLSRWEVKWDALSGSTRHERLVMALQVFAQGLVPGTYVIEQLGEDDPDAILKQAQLEKMQMQQFMQGLAPQQPQQGGDPGQQQQNIMSPMQGNIAGGEGGNPAAAMQQGGGPGAPGGGGVGPVQPGPPQSSMPPFSPQQASPAQQGAGPAPQAPDVMSMIRSAVNSLPADVQNSIAGPPSLEGGALVITVTDRKLIASGIIKRAFEAQNLPMPVKIRLAN